MSEYRVPALRVLWANYLTHHSKILAHSTATLDTQTSRKKPLKFIKGIPSQEITNRNKPINKRDWSPPWYNESWFLPSIPSYYDTRMYYRLRFFLGQDLRAILAINPSTLVAIRDHLLNRYDDLLKDIFEGTILGKKTLKPMPELSRQLAKIRENMDFSLNKVWPNLSLISSWTSSSAKLYIPKLKEIYPKARILPFMSCGTEAIVTLPVDDHPTTGPLAINQGYYEFIHASYDLEEIIKNSSFYETLRFDQLEPGKEYHLITSQANGMCRYAVGDIYKVIGFYDQVPRLEFMRRNGVLHSFTGEKLTETHVLNAFKIASKKMNIIRGLFVCAPVWGDPPFYKILLERNGTQVWEKFEKQLDKEIREQNKEYDSKRCSKRLGGLKLILVRPGTFDTFYETQKKSGNATQLKYRSFYKDDSIINSILNTINHEE